ncbi:hypothetical protein C8J57DRAFT_1241543 [Mycena rebaudengoi]|nr:hypothetical protein C8J57DRAFT_1241543 [Mycena rebaudengoi]
MPAFPSPTPPERPRSYVVYDIGSPAIQRHWRGHGYGLYGSTGGERDKCRQGCKDIDGTPAVKFGDMCTCVRGQHRLCSTGCVDPATGKRAFKYGDLCKCHPKGKLSCGSSASTSTERERNCRAKRIASELDRQPLTVPTRSIDDPQRRWERVGVMQQDKEREQQTLSRLVHGMWSKDHLQYVDEKYRSEVTLGAPSTMNLWVFPILKEESGPFTSSHRCSHIIDLRKIIGRIQPVHNNTTEVELEFRSAFDRHISDYLYGYFHRFGFSFDQRECNRVLELRKISAAH